MMGTRDLCLPACTPRAHTGTHPLARVATNTKLKPNSSLVLVSLPFEDNPGQGAVLALPELVRIYRRLAGECAVGTVDSKDSVAHD